MAALRCWVMRCFTNGFKCGGSAVQGELKAVLFAVLSCLLFIGFLAVISSTPRRERRVSRVYLNPPPPPPLLPAPRLAERPPDLNSRFRIVPSNFKGISFETRSYGYYRLSDGTNRNLTLIDGQFRDFGNSSNWFDLNDVYYTDLTGDGYPEAIALLTHLECGRTCDGGKSLFYVYSQTGGLKEILKYESGSGFDGCSLKSLIVKNGRLTLELFGRCPNQEPTNILAIRDMSHLTRVEFSFNGKKLVEKGRTVLTVPDNNEVNYGVDVRITDDRTPDSHEL
jgi:hypothetical protein